MDFSKKREDAALRDTGGGNRLATGLKSNDLRGLFQPEQVYDYIDSMPRLLLSLPLSGTDEDPPSCRGGESRSRCVLAHLPHSFEAYQFPSLLLQTPSLIS